MSKRYYVEVAGLGEDGKEQLRQAGVSEESILVVEDKDLPPVEQAIKEATGITMEQMKKEHNLVAIVSARILYVHYRLEEGIALTQVAKEIGKNARYTRFYRQRYDEKMFGDREFQAADSRVSALLHANPMWHTFELRKSTTEAKNVRKRKRKKKNRRKPRPPQAIIDQIIDKRQLNINFEE